MKYIVYKTINKVNNYIYIGVHKTADPEVFDGYIGCGVNIYKAASYDKAKLIYINNREVYKYDINGNFICGYATQHEAEKYNLGSNITKAIKNKKPCKNNFLWSLNEVPKFCSVVSRKKPVGKFTTDGILLQQWESVKACVDEIGIAKAYITHEKIYKGFIYKHI